MNIPIDTFEAFGKYDDFVVPMIVVYKKPTDFPEKYVARLFDIDKATAYIVIADSMEEIKEKIPPNFINIGRNIEDDVVIECVYVGINK